MDCTQQVFEDDGRPVARAYLTNESFLVSTPLPVLRT